MDRLRFNRSKMEIKMDTIINKIGIKILSKAVPFLREKNVQLFFNLKSLRGKKLRFFLTYVLYTRESIFLHFINLFV